MPVRARDVGAGLLTDPLRTDIVKGRPGGPPGSSADEQTCAASGKETDLRQALDAINDTGMRADTSDPHPPVR